MTLRLRTLGVALLLGALSGCASARAPEGPPPDVRDEERVQLYEREGFRFWVEQGATSGAELERLALELVRAREVFVALFGRARAPGDFRPPSRPRGYHPQRPAPPLPEWIDVVVLEGGTRCHADEEGLTLLARHLWRRDGTHELVHFLAGSSWRPIDEGLAVYLTEDLWGPERGFSVKVRARVFLDLGLDERLEPPAMRAGMSRLHYDTAGAFVRWLIEAHGWERFWQLYHGPERAYLAAYGVGEVELWRRFWRYIGNLDLADDPAYRAYKALVRSRR